MRPFNVVLTFVAPIGLALLFGFTERKRKSVKITVWTGFSIAVLLWMALMPDEIGPATWGEVADDLLPDGYVSHSVDTWVSVGDGWIVGETKTCKSYPHIPKSATYFRRGNGYAADSLNCDEGAMHMVKAELYGRLHQPEHNVAYWYCTRKAEYFACLQTGAD